MSIRPRPPVLLLASCLAWGTLRAITPTNAVPATAPATVPDDAAPSGTTTEPAAPPATNAAPTHPFTAIPARNVFQIKPVIPPPPVEPEVPKTPPPPPPNVFLTGFSSWKGVKKVYLQVTRPGSKSADYLDLRVGEQQFDIKVLEINDREESAKILNGDQEVTLNFRENGLKATGGPSPGGQGIPNPVNNGITSPRLAGQPGGGSGPSYIGRGGMAASGGGNTAVPPPNVNPVVTQGNEAAVPDLRTLPSRTTGATGNSGTGSMPQPVSPNQVRVINGKTLPPPPPLPVDINAIPGNGN
jgi:hypothetical protein